MAHPHPPFVSSWTSQPVVPRSVGCISKAVWFLLVVLSLDTRGYKVLYKLGCPFVML